MESGGLRRCEAHISADEQIGRPHLVRATKETGAKSPRHRHEATEYVFVLSGSIEVGGFRLCAGYYLSTDAGEEHDLVAIEDSVI